MLSKNTYAMARPPKEINWEKVKQKMEAGCPASEIFSSRDHQISENTFYRRFKKEFGCSFGDYCGELAQCGKGDIRWMLHAKCLNNKAPGNITGLIFKAKCELGMREPELLNILAANQGHIDQTHEIMRLQHRIAELEANANQSQTE